MDLDPTREQKDFRIEVRNWLKGNVPKERLPSMDTQEGFQLHRAWKKNFLKTDGRSLHGQKSMGEGI